MNSTTNFHQSQNKAIVSMGYDNIETNITLSQGHGSTFPDPSFVGPYNVVWWNASDYTSPIDDPHVEIVRCIAKIGDTLVVMRSQQQTLASPKNVPGKSYSMTPFPYNNLETLSYYNIPQTHGIASHTGTIGDHTANLSNVGTNTHTQIDTAIGTTLPGLVTTHAGLTATHGVSSAIVGVDDSQTLTNKYIYDANSFVIAQGIRSATTMVYTASSAAPSAGQVLTATSSGNATWQTPSPSVGSMKNLVRGIVPTQSFNLLSITDLGKITDGDFNTMSTQAETNGTGYVEINLGGNFVIYQAGINAQLTHWTGASGGGVSQAIYIDIWDGTTWLNIYSYGINFYNFSPGYGAVDNVKGTSTTVIPNYCNPGYSKVRARLVGSGYRCGMKLAEIILLGWAI